MSRSTFSSRSSGTPFQRLLQQHCQKVSASKSAGVVGKWGSASFTSIRRAANNPVVGNNTNKPNKFFKSRSGSAVTGEAARATEETASESTLTKSHTLKRSNAPTEKLVTHSTHNDQPTDSTKKSRKTSTNKFFVSKQSQSGTTEDKDKRGPLVPPLRLKIRSPSKACDSRLSDRGGATTQLEEDEKTLVANEAKQHSRRNREDRTNDTPTHNCGEEAALVTEDVSLDCDDCSKEVGNDVLRPLEGGRLDEHEQVSPKRLSSDEKPSNVEEDVVAISQDEDGDTQPFEYEPTEGAKHNDLNEPRSRTEVEVTIASNTTTPHCSTTEAEVLPCPISEELGRSRSDPTSFAIDSSSITVGSVTKKDALTTSASTFAQPSAPKRRCIFKSKSESSNRETGNKKALYKHKWTADGDEREQFKQEVFQRAVLGKSSTASSGFDFGEDEESGMNDNLPPTEMSFASSKLTRVQSNDLNVTQTEVVSIKCPKAQRDYFTVVKNVKKAHQIQDSGEFQEFNDDVDYILGGLGSFNTLSTRCLSTVTLATKCMEPSFRMHLRAHGTVTNFFAELKDAPDNPSLALCAATVLFVLSQDRLNMDLDRDSLELMLNLLDTESKIKDALETAGLNNKELSKNKQKVLDLVSEMKSKGHASSLSLEHISADHLSMETLLSLTSKRAGEWFKEELRDLGGLDHLVRTLSECVSFLTSEEISIWTEPLHEKLKKAGRVLKVLENVSHENEENCNYLLKKCGGDEDKDGKFLDLIIAILKLVCDEIPLNTHNDGDGEKDSVVATLRETLFDVIRVLINVVHDYNQSPLGSAMAGDRLIVFDLALQCLFTLPGSLPTEKRFDVAVLALTIIINLIENCDQNRLRLMKCHVPESASEVGMRLDHENAVHGLIRVFLEKEESARTEEKTTDTLIDGMNVKSEDGQNEEKTKEERIDETVAKLLHKAGRHMEDTLVASYISLIIGYLIKDDKEREREVRTLLPNHRFDSMVAVLKKFFNFMRLTASSLLANSRGLKATEMILRHLQALDEGRPEVKVHPEREEDRRETSTCSNESSKLLLTEDDASIHNLDEATERHEMEGS